MTPSTPPGLDIHDHTGPDYKAVLQSDGDWMAAIKNGWPESWAAPAELSRHMLTDEMFVLVAGRACLLIAGQGDAPGELVQVEMTPNILYNIRKGTWHGNLLAPDARLIIVERKETGPANSEFAPLTPDHRAAIRL